MLLAQKGVDPSAYENSAIALASENGHFNIVEALLADKRVDPSDQKNYAIIRAARSGHDKIVKLLLKDPRVDPSAQKQSALISACRSGHAKIVKALLKDTRVDPTVKDYVCFFHAAQSGEATIVKLFLESSKLDPSIQNNKAMKLAAENKHVEVISLLASDPRVSLSFDFQEASDAGVIYNALKEQHKIYNELSKNEQERVDHIKLLNEKIAQLREEIVGLRGVFDAKNEENDTCKEAIEKLEGIKSFALYYIQNLTGILQGNINPNDQPLGTNPP